jgi:hypothetical protein
MIDLLADAVEAHLDLGAILEFVAEAGVVHGSTTAVEP